MDIKDPPTDIQMISKWKALPEDICGLVMTYWSPEYKYMGHLKEFLFYFQYLTGDRFPYDIDADYFQLGNYHVMWYSYGGPCFWAPRYPEQYIGGLAEHVAKNGLFDRNGCTIFPAGHYIYDIFEFWGREPYSELEGSLENKVLEIFNDDEPFGLEKGVCYVLDD